LEQQIIKNQKNDKKSYAYLKISDGCNRGCHFCIIPKLRGEFRDIDEEDILRELHLILKNQKKEICIVSQDTIFYKKNLDDLKNLIRKISLHPNLSLLRLLYLYPDKKTFHLLDLFSELPIIAPYFESPIQHASEDLLKKMNRSGSNSFYKELFQKARDSKKDLEIRTSVIVGYPGETEKDFLEIENFLYTVKPEKLAIFTYSPQEGTKGFELIDDIPQDEKARRANYLREIHLNLLKDIHHQRIGKTYDCIVDSVNKNEAIVRRFQDAPEIDEIVFTEPTNLKIGQMGKITINSFAEYDMEGTFTPN
jgi:ribosomal protein S12 methylthiotransferase